MDFLSVQVPAGAKAGDTLEATDPDTGVTYRVTVPPGAFPGSAFQMQVGSPAKKSQLEVDSLMASAGKAALSASQSVGKALASITWSAAKKAHETGADKKAAGLTASAVGAGLTGLGKLAGAAGNALLAPSSTAAGSGSATGTFWCIVPPGAGAGSQLLVISPEGQQVMVEVPAGMKPGSQMEVHV